MSDEPRPRTAPRPSPPPSGAPRSGGPERIGLIVIHGNGEAEPGWINRYIVPRLDARLAATGHNARLVFADRSEVLDLDADRTPDTRAQPDTKSTEPKPDEPTRGESSTDEPRPQEGQHPAETDDRFKTFIRRAVTGGGSRVAFTELNWADLNHIGPGPLLLFIAALRLFYDAPNVLARAMLPRSGHTYHRVLRRLVLIAIWIVRWLVAGLNGVMFLVGLVFVLISVVRPPTAKLLGEMGAMDMPDPLVGELLVWVLMAVIAALVAMSLFLALAGEQRNFGLTDVWLATACMGAVGLVVIGLRVSLSADLHDVTLLALVRPAIRLNFAFGIAWDVVAAAAIAMWLPLCVKRAIAGAPAGAPSLVAISAALALAIVQAQVWKIGVPAAGALTLNVLGWRDLLQPEFDRLNGVGVLNSVLTAIDVVIAVVLLRCGRWIRWLQIWRWRQLCADAPPDAPALLSSPPLARAAALVPRVILSSVLVAALAAGTFCNLYLHYALDFGGMFGTTIFEPLCGRDDIAACIAGSPWLKLIIIVVGVAVGVMLAFGWLQSAVNGVVTFGRAIVDHQFKPDHLVTKLEREREGHGEDVYPRRARVRRRLDALIANVVLPERFDRLVILTHSQGSVIAYDALRSPSAQMRAALSAAREVAVVTLGSPMSHLYQHYFEDYAASGRETGWLPANLVSWTNVWRIDDPIAGRVVIGADGGVVDNVPLEPGGHHDYWKDDEVCDLILGLVEDTPPGTVRRGVVRLVATAISR